MSEFVDPIKNVKKKVKLLDEASKVIKSSLRQQLERQREIKGLEVAKTQFFEEQAKPIVQAVGTQPSEEEKKLGKENDRSILIQDMIEAGIPSYDPSYNIILKLFDDSYDTIKSRKTDSLKQKGIDMMVSSVDSLLTDSDYFPIPTPIGKLSKNIFEKIFLNKDYTLTDMLKTNVKLHEQMIQDREQTEAERTQVEAEKKIEEEKKAIEAQAEKVKAEKSEEELKRIESENKSSDGLKKTMFIVYKNRLKEQGIDLDNSNIKTALIKAFNFIHPLIITETDDNIRKLKIQGLIESPAMKNKVFESRNRKKVSDALLRTYTRSIVNYTTSKSSLDPDFIPNLTEIEMKTILPKKEIEMTEISKSKPIPETKSEPTPEPTPAPTPSLLPETTPTPEEISQIRKRYPELIEGNSTFERLENYKAKNSSSYSQIYNTDTKRLSANIGLINSNIEKFYNTNNLTPIDKIYGKIDAIDNYILTYGRIKKETLPSEKIEQLSKSKDRLKETVDRLLSKDVMYPSDWNPDMKGYGLKKGKKQQKGGFNFLSMFAPIPLVGNGIRKKLGIENISGKGMTILNPKNFQKGMKKKANEDLLHNLQVHMSQVQAGNNNLKLPISMLVDEAIGRGIMKKQVGNKIKKHFVN